MRKLCHTLAIALVTVSLNPLSGYDSHGAVHIIMPDGEEEVDGGGECCDLIDSDEEMGRPPRPWYQNQKFDVLDDYGDPTLELEEETAWPSQREEFSDILFR